MQAMSPMPTPLPILFVSLDAHALRRHIDEAWDAAWKMCNGHQRWCLDRDTGAIMHRGGEYVWGADFTHQLVAAFAVPQHHEDMPLKEAA